MRFSPVLLLALAPLAAGPARAADGAAGGAHDWAADRRADWIVAAGVSDFSHKGSPSTATLSVEWQFRPLWHLGRWQIGPAAAITWDESHDLWAGVGLAAHRDFGRWFVELGEMPGLYRKGRPSTDLGGPVEFRSLIGIGYRISETTSLSLAAYHRSNADIYRPNPGVNTISLRLIHRF